MPIIEFLKGHIAIDKTKRNLFQLTKLYSDYILTQEIIDDESDPIGYSEIGKQLFIEFSDLSAYDYSEVIEQDLIFLLQKTPGTEINLLLWTADQDFNAKNYFTNDLNELQVKELIEAPTRTVFTPKELEITS